MEQEAMSELILTFESLAVKRHRSRFADGRLAVAAETTAQFVRANREHFVIRYRDTVVGYIGREWIAVRTGGNPAVGVTRRINAILASHTAVQMRGARSWLAVRRTQGRVILEHVSTDGDREVITDDFTSAMVTRQRYQVPVLVEVNGFVYPDGWEAAKAAQARATVHLADQP